jgi:hypothetical protein
MGETDLLFDEIVEALAPGGHHELVTQLRIWAPTPAQLGAGGFPDLLGRELE